MDREAWRWGIGAWLALRAISVVAALWSAGSLPSTVVDVPAYTPPALSGPLAPAIEPWLRADALWYMRITEQGYADDGTLAFFPALPAVAAMVEPALGNEAYATWFVASLACLLGLVVLFALVRKLLDARAARAAVVGLALFPTSFFLVAPYGEAMLLLTGSAALLALAHKRWGWAFLAGAAAALSRPFGVLIALPMATVTYRQGGSRARWLAPVGPAAGLALWAGYTWRLTGDPWAMLQVQSSWLRELTPVWETLRLGVEQWQQYDPPFQYYVGFDVAATLFGLTLVPVVAWVLWRGGKPPWAIGLALYGLAAMAAPLLLPFRPRALMSIPRFVLALFPLFTAYALVPAKLRIPLGLASAAGLAVATAVYVAGRPLF